MSESLVTAPVLVRRDTTMDCSSCGHSSGIDTDKIKTLEEEIQFLTEKAQAAADKLADYEEEISHLKTARNDSPVDASLLAPEGSGNESPTQPTRPTATAGRFSFLSSRKPLPNLPAGASTNVTELQTALARESALRQEAESKVATLSSEVEDLSVTLFEQANEMVATERRARAKLEEKVNVLEEREKERKRRLERVEMALARLERVRTLLAT